MPKLLYCSDLDLFGDVIVTVDDIERWLDAVPHIGRNQTRQGKNYAKNWNVANKIKLCKLDGTFEKVISEGAPDYRDLHTVDDVFGSRYT